GSVGLRRNVDGLGVVTDQTTVGRFLDRHRLQLIGGKAAVQGTARDDIAVCNRAITSADDAVARVAHFLVYAEKLGGLFDQSDATCSASLAERHERMPYRPTGAGYHQTPLGIGINIIELHLVPIRLELVEYDARKGRADMLAHLGPDDRDSDDAAAIDAVPDRWLEQCGRRGRSSIGGYKAGTRETKQNARSCCADQEATTGYEILLHYWACKHLIHVCLAFRPQRA